MNMHMKIVIAATALGLGLAASPVSAQGYGYDRGVAGYDGRAERPTGYNDDGTLNVFGAHINPPGGRGGLVGGAGNAVGGVVGGVTGATDDIVTGSIGGRGDDYSSRGGYAEPLDRSVSQYGRNSGGPGRGY